MPTDHGRFKFYYEKKVSDFFDNDLFKFAVQDMNDKYFGNAEKNELYYEALERVLSHIVTNRFVFADGSLREGEYQTIESYSRLEEDLKLLQLEGLKEKLEKTSKHSAGDKSIYGGDEEKYNEDAKYIETNNFAYDRNALTVQNLKTLGRYGDIVKFDNPILKALFAVRNFVSAPIHRFVGRGVSKAYESKIKGPSGLYSNKPTHRYRARKDHFIAKERERLKQEGKKGNDFLILWKARFQAAINVRQGNEEILKLGQEKIRANLNVQAETKYLSDKYKALTYHIDDLKRKFLTYTDENELTLIKKHLEIALREKEGIERNSNFYKTQIKIEGLEQTDVISLEQHRLANKDNVTRVVSGVKLLATLGVAYVGPKAKKWILDNTQIEDTIEKSVWVPTTGEGSSYVPGHFETMIEKELAINPRVLKICNITEEMMKTLSKAEIVGIIYENLREDKPENIERINVLNKEKEDTVYVKLRSILDISDASERYAKLEQFEDLDKLTHMHKFEIIKAFVNNPEYLIKLLENDKFYSKENIKIVLGTVTDGKLQKGILSGEDFPELLRKIQNTEFEPHEVEFLLNTFGKNDKTLVLFPEGKFTYKYNEELILRNTTLEYNEEIINILLRYNNIPEEEKETVRNKIKELYDINDEILQTVNFKMLTSRFDRLNVDLNVLTVYPGLQEKIVGLSDEELKYFECVLKYSREMEIDWVPLVSDVVSNIGKYYDLIHDEEFGKYLDTITVGNDSEKILDFSKFLSIMTSENVYDIESYEELKSFTRQDNFSKMYKLRLKDPKYQKLSELDKMKDLTCLKLIGQDLETVKKFIKYYGSDYEGMRKALTQTDEEIKKYVLEIYKIDETDPKFSKYVDTIKKENSMMKYYLTVANGILNAESFEYIEKLFNSIEKEDEIFIPKATIESRFRSFFVREKNKVIYRPDDKDVFKVGEEDAYLIDGEFGLQLTSIESYASDEWIFGKNDSKSVLDWDCKKIKTHGISSVYCGNSNLSLPPIHGICYGFSSLHENTILKSAPWDLGAWSYNSDFDILRSEAEFGTRFLLPREQLKQSLRRHNEDVLERRNLNYKKGDKYFKLQPSYLISFVEPKLSTYFKEDTEDVLTSERLQEVVDMDKLTDREYRVSVMNSELQGDSKWSKTIEESKTKGLKKCVVDRTHTMITERLKMDEKEKRLLAFSEEDLKDPNKRKEFLGLMEDVIVEFDESRAGCIQKKVLGWNQDGGSDYGDLLHKEMYEKLFSYKVMDDKLGKIQAKLWSLDEETRNICFEKLKDISKKQVEKISNSYWWYEYDTSHDWYHYYGFAGRVISNITFGEDDKKVEELLDRKMPGTDLSAGQYVNRIISEIKSIHEYDIPDDEPDWHGRKHINNVVLFSYLIAENENKLDKNNLDLLLQAAKYHDVGRDGIWNGQGEGLRHDKDDIPHAHPSADAAEYYMKKEKTSDGKTIYTDSQIAMVKVAIEYHEVNEKDKNKFDQEVFEDLCRREGVKKEDLEQAKLMCIYLKDADALDRTRFVYKEKGKQIEELKDNLDITYLRTNSAIGLRDFARGINDRNLNLKEEGEKGDKNIRPPKILEKYSVIDSKIYFPWEFLKMDIKQFKQNKAEERDKRDRFSYKKIREIVYASDDKTEMLEERRTFKGFIETAKKFFRGERD